jgi:hypothetical protein
MAHYLQWVMTARSGTSHYIVLATPMVRALSTFSLLGQVYQLQAGDAKSIVPVLTLPVGN